MTVTLNGFTIQKSPRDLSLLSYPVIHTVAAGLTDTIDTATLFNGIARSVSLVNQDGANNALARINGITTNQFNVPASGQVGFSDQWINQIQVTAGAGGSLIVMLEIVPFGGSGIGV